MLIYKGIRLGGCMTWSKWAKAQKQNLNRIEISKKLGISEGAFQSMESGRAPVFRTIYKIAQAKGLKVWQLVKEVEEF